MRDRSEASGKVFAVAREQSDLTVGLQTERTIAVKLQLVRPGRSFGQLGNRYCEHGLDKSDLTFRDIHYLNVAILKSAAITDGNPERLKGSRTFVVPTSPMSLRCKTDARSFQREAAEAAV